jgi:hypothetical protein
MVPLEFGEHAQHPDQGTGAIRPDRSGDIDHYRSSDRLLHLSSQVECTAET